MSQHVLPTSRYDEYPKMREMTHLKEALITKHATTPYYLKV